MACDFEWQAASGDVALLNQAMEAANESSRKIGKLFLSHNSQQLSLVCFVPEVLIYMVGMAQISDQYVKHKYVERRTVMSKQANG